MSMRRDSICVEPWKHELSPYSDEVLVFDTTALLVGGDPPSAPVCHLHEVGQDAPVTLQDAPVISGTTIQQRVRGLVARRTYELHVTFMTSGNRRDMKLFLVCVP